MFKKSKYKNKRSQIDTLIGQETHIQGDISFSGGLRIDGSVIGNVHATGSGSSTLTLSDHGRLEGEIKVPNVILNGSIKGDVYASEYIELASDAKIQGNVYYRLLDMAVGSEVNGQLIHLAEDDNVLNLAHEEIDDKDDLRLG